MPTLPRLAFLLSLSVLLTACDTAYMVAMEKMGYAKRDILSSRVKSARDAQEDAKKDIQNALDQFGKVVAYQGGDLDAAYKTLSRELQNSEEAAGDVRKRIKDVESVADALFSEWKDELGQYSSADLRRKSEEKLTLNARALAAIKGELVKVDAQVDQLVKDVNRSLRPTNLFSRWKRNRAKETRRGGSEEFVDFQEKYARGDRGKTSWA